MTHHADPTTGKPENGPSGIDPGAGDTAALSLRVQHSIIVSICGAAVAKPCLCLCFATRLHKTNSRFRLRTKKQLAHISFSAERTFMVLRSLACLTTHSKIIARSTRGHKPTDFSQES